jgi:hypothetical protein
MFTLRANQNARKRRGVSRTDMPAVRTDDSGEHEHGYRRRERGRKHKRSFPLFRASGRDLPWVRLVTGRRPRGPAQPAAAAPGGRPLTNSASRLRSPPDSAERDRPVGSLLNASRSARRRSRCRSGARGSPAVCGSSWTSKPADHKARLRRPDRSVAGGYSPVASVYGRERVGAERRSG